MNFQIFGPCEDLSTALEQTHKGSFSRVYSDMVDQLVLGFERVSLPRAALPVTRVVGLLRAPHVVECQMQHSFIDRVKHLTTDLEKVLRSACGGTATVGAGDGCGWKDWKCCVAFDVFALSSIVFEV